MTSKLARAIPLAFVLLACSSSTEETASTPCSPTDGTKVTDQAVTADGRYVTVLGSGPGARLFYGPADHMTEGHITATNAGCFQSYEFMIGVVKYTAVLAYRSCNGNVLTRLYRDEAQPFERMQLVTAFGAPVADADPIAGAVTNGVPASNPTFYCF